MLDSLDENLIVVAGAVLILAVVLLMEIYFENKRDWGENK